MPHPEIVKALEKIAQKRSLSSESVKRVLAWLNQSESSDFPNKDREEQLGLILDTFPGYPDTDDTNSL